MLPAVIVSIILGSVPGNGSGGRGMRQPFHGMAADLAVALRDIGPLGVLLQMEKDAQGAWVGSEGQHDFVTFAERLIVRSPAHRHRLPLYSAVPVIDRRVKHGRGVGCLRGLREGR